MGPPESRTLAVPVLNTDTSAKPPTRVTAGASSFSGVTSAGDETDAMLVMNVPFGTAAVPITSVNVALAPATKVAIVQVIVPPPPTAGVVQVNAGPEFCAKLVKVAPAGTLSVRVTVVASSGPKFVTLIE